MLKPVHDHTVPKISPRRRVLGVTSQLTSSDLIPSHPKKAGTTPIGYSRTNRRTTPTTMSGVTIPRKISDLTNEAPRTFCRRTARNRPMKTVSGRGMPIQIRSFRRVPQGGTRARQAGLKASRERTPERIADRVVQVRQDGLALHERCHLGVEGRIRGGRNPRGRRDVSADADLDRLGLFR